MWFMPEIASSVITAAVCGGTATWRIRRLRYALLGARHAADHDPLTGLPNRRALMNHLHETLGGPQPTAVVLLDLDGYKAINDTHGHDAGDRVLCHVAQRIEGVDPRVRLAARLGGDEFALVVHGDQDTALAVAAAAACAINHDPFQSGGRAVPLQASVGVAARRSGDTVRELLRHADIAMYVAKAAGRACDFRPGHNHVHARLRPLGRGPEGPAHPDTACVMHSTARGAGFE